MADDDVVSMSIRALKAELAERGVSTAGIIEKTELIDALRAARLRQRSVGSSSAPSKPSMSQPWAAPASKSGGGSDKDNEAVARVLQCARGDLYGVLGVERSADGEALKRAYRKLALQLHPDKCDALGASDAFKRVSAAFAVLSDSRKRAAHDFGCGEGEATGYGGTGDGAAPRRTGGGSGGFHSTFGDQDAEELFRAFFGYDSAGTSSGSSSAGRSSSSMASPGAGDLMARAEAAAGLFQRLGAAFAKNPWTLVTLLSALVSFINIFETVITHLGAWTVAAIPAAAVGIWMCPPPHRKFLGTAVVVVLISGFF